MDIWLTSTKGWAAPRKQKNNADSRETEQRPVRQLSSLSCIGRAARTRVVELLASSSLRWLGHGTPPRIRSRTTLGISSGHNDRTGSMDSPAISLLICHPNGDPGNSAATQRNDLLDRGSAVDHRAFHTLFRTLPLFAGLPRSLGGTSFSGLSLGLGDLDGRNSIRSSARTSSGISSWPVYVSKRYANQ